MEWNAELYDDKHDFVAEYGKGLLEYILDNENFSILDVGCGTGSLTNELSKKTNKLIGIDGSADMIQQAKNMYPHIEFQVMDACNLTWKNYFDVVFSNAVFHWIKSQDLLLSSIYDALKTDGKLVCEFGCYGNIHKIQEAFQAVLKKFNYEYVSPFYFPKKEEYQDLLIKHCFKIELIIDYDRPTPLNDNELGLRNWIKQFFANTLLNFPDKTQNEIFNEMENILRPELWDGQKWIADYRRIRVVASKHGV